MESNIAQLFEEFAFILKSSDETQMQNIIEKTKQNLLNVINYYNNQPSIREMYPIEVNIRGDDGQITFLS